MSRRKQTRLVEEVIFDKHNLEVAVFDPAHRKAGSYCQWANVVLDSAWESAAEAVHKAWPATIGGFEDQSAVLLGVLDDGAGSRWFYRVYPGGRDSFGRPGRYFFVLFRFTSPEQALLPVVSGLLDYFDAERCLPLRTARLDEKLPHKEPSALLSKLVEQWIHGGNSPHWGMDGSGAINRFAPAHTTSPTYEAASLVSSPRQPSGQLNRRELAIGFVAGLAIGLVLGHLSAGSSDSSNQGQTPISPPNPLVAPSPPQSETKGTNERTNPKGRLEDRPTEKQSPAGSATNQTRGKPLDRR